MAIDNLDLNLLRVFDAIYKEQSLSKAATRLGLSQPGISQALNRLREATGDILFVRQAHGMAPTVYSEAIAQPIQQALDSILTTLQTHGALDIRHVSRTLRIAMSDYSQALVLPRLLPDLAREAPRLRIDIVPDSNTDLHAALYEGDIALAIGALFTLDEHFRHQELFRDDFVCISRANHPLLPHPLTLEAYLDAPHATFTARKAPLIDQACQRLGIQRKVGLVVPNFLSLPFVIATTDHIATMPRRLLQLLPEHLPLQVHELPFKLPTAIMRQYWAERTHRDPVCGWLRDRIQQAAGTLASNMIK